MDIKDIRNAFQNKAYRYTRHGAEQRIKRHITESEIEETIFSGKVIEEYPEDKYGPSCLILGWIKNGRPLHVQVALYPMASIVTVYEPDPEKWINSEIRRRE